ncbi:MAG: response regulator [Verrucomicrobiaceae bacterium]|jgi:CheY-like chemotaxis protein|nr:response regulator [Verrucomicrobiaceae bacterium]
MKLKNHMPVKSQPVPEVWEHSKGADQYEKSHRLPSAGLHKKILVVDDEVYYMELLKMTLEDTGRFEVALVSDGTRVLEVARDFEPDLILLDIVMPGVDGGDIAAQLRLDRKLGKVPVIFVTALVSASESTQGESVVRRGGRCMLSKPVHSKVLIETIDAAIRGRL